LIDLKRWLNNISKVSHILKMLKRHQNKISKSLYIILNKMLKQDSKMDKKEHILLKKLRAS